MSDPMAGLHEFAGAKHMNHKSIKAVLLIEDNPGDARLLREMFNDQGAHDTT